MINDIVKLIEDKKAGNIKIYSMKGSTIADKFIVLTSNSKVHAKTIMSELRKYFNKNNISFLNEGENNCGWIIVDAFDIVIHIFTKEMRDFYCIDELYEKSL